MRIGIDLLGSDKQPEELFPAVLQLVEQTVNQSTFVVFTTPAIHSKLASFPRHAMVEFHFVEDFITMADDPLLSIRQKKNSSLVIALRMLKKKQLNAFVTTGNTGALVAGATLMLPLLPGVKRPALLAVLPTLKEPLVVIDVGGNVTNKASHLLQLAYLGATYHRCYHNKPLSRIGLLNIGTESKKGTLELRAAYASMHEAFSKEKSAIDFVGNIEARDIFRGDIDVLVTDGFTGNTLLKTSEGVSSFIFEYLRLNSQKPLQHHVEAIQSTFDHTVHPGAIVCGIDGLIVKCHGNATAASIYSAVKGAMTLSERQLISSMKEVLSEKSES